MKNKIIEFKKYLDHQIRMIESHPQDYSDNELVGMQSVREKFEEVFFNEETKPFIITTPLKMWSPAAQETT